MPNLVGSNLQAAQDQLQAVTGNPLFYSSSHDMTIRYRRQILDRDWKVCTQSVPAGAQFTVDTVVDFGVVKLNETCP